MIMTIDVHKTCSGHLNRFLTEEKALNALLPEYRQRLNAFQNSVRGVYETCEILELVDQDIAQLLEELYMNPMVPTVTTPRFVHQLIDALIASGAFGLQCISRLASAMAEESHFRRIEDQVHFTEMKREKARKAYIDCLRKAGFEQSRRQGTL